MNKYIPYSHQSIGSDDIAAVERVLKSHYLTQGPEIPAFEKALCRYTGARYAVAVSSGTAALHISCLAAGVGPQDEVITSPITFAASANCALYCQGRPVFADVQEDTGNISPKDLKKKLSSRTKAIIPVHYGGHPCDLEEIRKIAKKRNLFVIEDAAHALGAKYKGSKIGSCRYSDMTILSFHPLKSITTGEGGAVLTNDKRIYERLLLLMSHGITKEKSKFRNKLEGDWFYEMQDLGFNYRMTDFQAALGISQLKKLGKFIARRRQIVGVYERIFRDNPYFELPVEKDYAYSSYHLYHIRLKDSARAGIKRGEVFAYLRKKGIGVQVHFIPVYLHPYYQKLGYKKGICKKAELFYQRVMSIPLHQGLTSRDIRFIALNVQKAFQKLS